MSDLSAAATQLLRRLDSHAVPFAAALDGAEEHARMPASVAQTLLREGFFRLWIPKANAGLELSLPEALAIYQAAAEIDGSLGWAVMIGAGGGLFAAWLPATGAQELFTPAIALVAGSGAPTGTAERVAGGYRVSGHWRYASGAHVASVFTAACVVTEGGVAVRDGAGAPVVRAMSIAPSQVRILDSWDPTGMRATGSHDFQVKDAWVPADHSFSVLTDEPRETGPLYRLPFGVLTELPVSAVGIGIGRHALTLFAEGVPEQKALASGVALVATRFAQAQAALDAAAATVTQLAEAAWRIVSRGGRLDAALLARITVNCCASQEQLRQAIAALAGVAGMRAIDRGNRFSRAWRDLQTLGAHGSLAPQRLAAAGELLLSQSLRSATLSSANVVSGVPQTLPLHT